MTGGPPPRGAGGGTCAGAQRKRPARFLAVLAFLLIAPLPQGARADAPAGAATLPATPPPVRVLARAANRRLELADPAAPGGFRPIFVKGVNLGVALPGRFPAEFPAAESAYLSWLESVSELGANTVRLYTLLPPAFYAALDRHNHLHPDRRLWLIQGVWTELPDGDDYLDPGFLWGFQAEIARVLDAVHGNLDQPVRPGHAHGLYRSDVSSSLLALLLGREWEPYSVKAFDEANDGSDGTAPRVPGPASTAARDSARREYRGVYVRTAPSATPFEAWLARVLDFAVAHETARYRQQHPVSFVNWPTLDPLDHPTESTVAEERALLRRKGLAQDHPIHEYDNDAVGVDATHLQATEAAGGGIYATYHAYPYYPDFMNLDPGYALARDAHGPCSYIGYLRDLARHHGSQPVLIAEVGVPSSRGIAHFQPQGMNHGGHTEREQGEIDARLVEDIREAGLAGAVLFSLLDEWFKRNWLATDFEVPYERNPLWLNILDPEQNYGLLAARPGAKAWKIVIDGRGDDWAGIPPLAVAGPPGGAAEPAPGGPGPGRGGTAAGGAGPGPERRLGDGHDGARALRALSATSDEAYLYLRLDVGTLDADGDGSPDWGHAAYIIGIDTYDAERGDHRLPLAGETVPSPAGLEFCLVLDGPRTGRLLVDTPYDIETHRYRRPWQSVRNEDGTFMEIEVETNRERIGRDGTLFPAKRSNRSALRYGSMDRRDADYDTLAEWKASLEGNFLELRIGWGLLNVTDPSSRRVLHDNPSSLKTVGTLRTPGFRLYAAAVKPEGPAGQATPIAARLADRLPRGDGLRAAELPVFAWPEWNQPSFRIEKKDSWAIVKKAFDAIPSSPDTP